MTLTPRAFITQLSAGVRTVLTDFENAIRLHERVQAQFNETELMDGADAITEDDRTELLMAQQNALKAKQTLIRKLLRIQNGPNEGNIEQLKRDFRKVCNAYIAVAGDNEHKQLMPDVWKIADDVSRGRKRL